MSDQQAPPDDVLPDARTTEVLAHAQRRIANRREAGAIQDAARLQSWQWAGAGCLLLGAIGVIAWPTGTLAHRLRLVAHGVCDQQHNLNFNGAMLPLDARCTGIYTGFLLTLLYLVGIGRARSARQPPLPIVSVLTTAICVMGLDGFNSMLQESAGYAVYAPHNALRLATGLAAGSAFAALGLPLFISTLWSKPRVEQPIIGTWSELFGIISRITLAGVIIWRTPAWLFYPLALFSIAAMFGLLFLLNLFVVALLGGMRRRVLLLGQLARHAFFSLLFTAMELTLLGWWRDMWEPVVSLGRTLV